MYQHSQKRKKVIAGFYLDILDMEYRVSACENHVFIEINDAANGWLPLFGVTDRGDFIGMPTCHPYDARSDQSRQDRSAVCRTSPFRCKFPTGRAMCCVTPPGRDVNIWKSLPVVW